MADRPSPHAHPPAHDLILRVCQPPLRVIAVIDAPRVVERILHCLGLWRDPPPRPPPHDLPEVLACRPGTGFGEPYRQLEMSQPEAHYL